MIVRPKKHDHVGWLLWPKEPIAVGDILKCCAPECKQKWVWTEKGWQPMRRSTP